jgi:gamma-glutamylcyclotransferase (GGCT)/AIG2-like uncharacterized protein YtfP
MREQYLFVYGSLRQGSGIPQQRLLRDHAELLGEAAINAVMYDIGAYPGILLSKNRSDIVSGELYRLKHHQQASLFAALDTYEECSEEFAEPHEFNRELVNVQLLHNKLTLRAWVYVFNRAVQTLSRITSGDYHRR